MNKTTHNNNIAIKKYQTAGATKLHVVYAIYISFHTKNNRRVLSYTNYYCLIHHKNLLDGI
jgi:hypothetical protein